MSFYDLHIFEISSVLKYVDPISSYPMKNNGRAHCGLILNEEGEELYHFKDRDVTVTPGTLLFIPKGEAYTIDMEDKVNVSLCINFECVEKSGLSPFKISFDNPSRLRALFTDAELLWKSKKIGYNSNCLSILHKIIAYAQRQEFGGLHPKNLEKIKTATEYLNVHFADADFKISKLYELSNVSPKYFGTLFKEQFGVSPKEYAIQLKIERAKELLSTEKLSVSEIGSELGFADLYHFSRVFKQVTSYSPTEYKKMLQK